MWSNVKLCGERNKEKQHNMKEGKTRGGELVSDKGISYPYN